MTRPTPHTDTITLHYTRYCTLQYLWFCKMRAWAPWTSSRFLQVGLPIHNGRLAAQDVVSFTKHCARLAMRRSPEVVPSRWLAGWLAGFAAGQPGWSAALVSNLDMEENGHLLCTVIHPLIICVVVKQACSLRTCPFNVPRPVNPRNNTTHESYLALYCVAEDDWMVRVPRRNRPHFTNRQAIRAAGGMRRLHAGQYA